MSFIEQIQKLIDRAKADPDGDAFVATALIVAVFFAFLHGIPTHWW
jgi:hypothetical protein